MRTRLADIRFLKDVRGASAVEFALVAGPLLFLICACIELALVFLLSVTLDNATEQAARGIRTGLTTSANTSKEAFRQSVCDNMGWLSGSCTSNLNLDVQTYDSFALAATPVDPLASKQVVASNFAYNVGAGSKIQMVRAYYEWPLFTPMLQGAFNKLSNNDIVITAKVVFRNEPFSS
ncbi:MAG: pilus assembly protein [Asticcacaulis sp.]|uniref:TadE/TadG family type IV pilus assembly protein n=1 Tax=Asticcacaulis sp. TaxID=1872648 RepID=UPI0039E26E71